MISYFLLRLLNLTSLPIFTDEAIYLRWSQIALQDPAWRFISLTDGKQPSYIWAVMIALQFISDPLLAGRVVSVAAGFFTLIGLWVLSYELFRSKKVAFAAGLLHVVYPFAQVHERLAIYDSLVAALYVWTLYFSVLLVRRVRLDIAYTLGVLIGAGFLTKSTNFVNLYLLPATLLLFDFSKKSLQRRFIQWVAYAILAAVISQAFYAILRLSPLFHMIEQKTSTFIYPFSVGFTLPFPFLWGNLEGLIHWLFDYLTVFYVALIIVGGLLLYKEYWREKLLLVIYFLLPFVGLAFVGKVLYPRFIFYMSVMLLPIAGLGLVYLWNYVYKTTRIFRGLKNRYEIIASVITLFFISYPLFISYTYAVDPINAPITKSDSNQYVNNWSAGWGVVEAVAFLQNEAADKKIFIGTQGTFGLQPFSMEMYLVDNKNVTIRGYWPIGDELPKELTDQAKKVATYLVIYQPPYSLTAPTTFPLQLVFEKKAGSSDHYFRLYRVLP